MPSVIEWVLGIAILVTGLFLIFAVLMQSGKDKRLSGSIAGGAETFFGKSKANTWDKILARLTTIVSIVFGVLVLVMYVIVSGMYA
ncbi:MAG: preprotein translocase subunit SecG [Ruminococcaceae bacterium]|nr:preprotein translocase subunit SecG [Oscillospiraceae bacterium]